MHLTEENPIACTLDDRTLQPRLAELRALTERSLLSHDLSGQTLRLVYRQGSVDEAQRIVELEQQCCSFLDFKLERVDSGVRLTNTAPAETGDAARWLFAQFLPVANPAAAPKACGCTGGCS